MNISTGDFNWLIAVALFAAAAAIESLFVSYMFQLEHRHTIRASLIAFTLAFAEAAGVIGFVTNLLYVLPVAVGAFAGTAIIVEREKRKTSPRRPAK